MESFLVNFATNCGHTKRQLGDILYNAITHHLQTNGCACPDGGHNKGQQTLSITADLQSRRNLEEKFVYFLGIDYRDKLPHRVTTTCLRESGQRENTCRYQGRLDDLLNQHAAEDKLSRQEALRDFLGDLQEIAAQTGLSFEKALKESQG